MDLNVILSIIVLAVVLKNIGPILEMGEAFVKAFKEVHEEIENEAKTNPNAYNFVFYDPHSYNKFK